MQQSSSKANSSSASQEISRILLNPIIHCLIPATCIFGESHQSSPGQPILFLTIRFTIFLPSMSGPFKQSLSIRLPHHSLYVQSDCHLNVPHVLSISCPSILSHKNVWRWMNITKLLLMYFSTASCCHSFLFNPNRLLSIPFSDTLSLYSSSSARDQISNPYKTRDNIIVLQIYITINQHSIILSQSNITVRCVN